MSNKSFLIKKLDSVFSEYIRRKNAVQNIAVCVTCNKYDNWKNLQAGHYIGRKNLSLRWSEENVYPQCKKCNVFNYGELEKYYKFLGQIKAEKLIVKGRQTLHLSKQDLKEKIIYYKSKLKILQ